MTAEATRAVFRLVWSYASHQVWRDAPALAKHVEEMLYPPAHLTIPTKGGKLFPVPTKGKT